MIIGTCGTFLPETLFWAEHESQTIIDHGATPLPHSFPTVGALGPYSLTDPRYLIAIGLVKLFAISITVLAGYRGGFIFPFMFAGQSIGMGCAIIMSSYGVPVSVAGACLSCACAINVAVTRTVLATPIVLATLSGRSDVFPQLLVASIISLYITGDESIIKAARRRWLRAELFGTEIMTDRSKPIDRNRILRSPGNSLRGGSAFSGVSFDTPMVDSTPPAPKAMV